MHPFSSHVNNLLSFFSLKISKLRQSGLAVQLSVPDAMSFRGGRGGGGRGGGRGGGFGGGRGGGRGGGFREPEGVQYRRTVIVIEEDEGRGAKLSRQSCSRFSPSFRPLFSYST